MLSYGELSSCFASTGYLALPSFTHFFGFLFLQFLMKELYLFFTMCSVLVPWKRRAMYDHLWPWLYTKCSNFWSSSSDHSCLSTAGSR